MNPLGSRARAEELARLLEGAIAAPSSSPTGYVALATRLRGVSPRLDDTFVPRAEFRTALRQRLLAVAAVQGAVAAPAEAPPSTFDAAVAWTQTWKAQRRIAAAAGAMAGVVAFAGVGIASSRSLPGQPFYGVKRAVEGLQLDLADGDAAKGTKHLEFAATRLREVQALAAGQDELALGVPDTPTASGLALGGSTAERIRSALHDFDAETRSGKALLERAYRRTGRTEPLKVLATFSTQQQHRLTGLLPDLPDSAASAAQQSLALVTSVGQTAAALLGMGTCSTTCDPAGAGPELPTPAPSPGTSASPSDSGDDNGVPPCGCGEPAPTPGPTTSGPTPEQTPSPSSSPSPTPSTTAAPTPQPTSSPTSSGLPLPLPTILPTALPTILPTRLPAILPTKLPAPLPNISGLIPPLGAIKP